MRTLLESSIETREGSGDGTRIAPRLTVSVFSALSSGLRRGSATSLGSGCCCAVLSWSAMDFGGVGWSMVSGVVIRTDGWRSVTKTLRRSGRLNEKSGGLISYGRHAKMRKAATKSTSHNHRQRSGPHSSPSLAIDCHCSPYVRSMADSLVRGNICTLIGSVPDSSGPFLSDSSEFAVVPDDIYMMTSAHARDHT